MGASDIWFQSITKIQDKVETNKKEEKNGSLIVNILFPATQWEKLFLFAGRSSI